MRNWLAPIVFVCVALPYLAYRLLVGGTWMDLGITAHPRFQDFASCVIRPGEQFISGVQFKNSSETALVIHSATAGCGCATVSASQSFPATISPGEVITCAVRINPLAAELVQELHVTATWGNSLSEGLQKETSSTIRFQALPRVISLPQVVSFGQPVDGAEIEQRVTLYGDSREPISPDSLSFAGPDRVSYKFVASSASIPRLDEVRVELGQLTIRFDSKTADVPLSQPLVVNAVDVKVCEIPLFGYPSIVPVPDPISK